MVDQTKLTLSDESGQEMKHPNKLLKHLEESEMKSLPRPYDRICGNALSNRL